MNNNRVNNVPNLFAYIIIFHLVYYPVQNPFMATSD